MAKIRSLNFFVKFYVFLDEDYEKNKGKIFLEFK